jgi:hypothetical protein
VVVREGGGEVCGLREERSDGGILELVLAEIEI